MPARAVVAEAELRKLGEGQADPVRLRPGMPVEVPLLCHGCEILF